MSNKNIQIVSKSAFHIKTPDFDAEFSMKGFNSPIFKYEDKNSYHFTDEAKVVYTCDMLYALLFTKPFEKVDTTRIKYYLNAAKNEAVISLIYKLGFINLHPVYIDKDDLSLLSNPMTAKDVIRVCYAPGFSEYTTTVPAFIITKRFKDLIPLCEEFLKEPAPGEELIPVDGNFIIRKYSGATDYTKREEPYLARWFYDYTDVFYDVTNRDILSTKDLVRSGKKMNFRTSKDYDAGQLVFATKSALLRLGTYSIYDKHRDSYNEAMSVNGCNIFIPTKNGMIDALRLGYVRTEDNKLVFFNLAQINDIFDLVVNDNISAYINTCSRISVKDVTTATFYTSTGESTEVLIEIFLSPKTTFDMASIASATRFEMKVPSKFNIINPIILQKYVVSKENSAFIIGEGMYYGTTFYMTKHYPQALYRNDIAYANIDEKGEFIFLINKKEWTEELFTRALMADEPLPYKKVPAPFRT